MQNCHRSYERASSLHRLFITKWIFIPFLALFLSACASIDDYAEDCESSAATLEECIYCFHSKISKQPRAYSRNREGVEFLLDAAESIVQKVRKGELSEYRGRQIFVDFANRVEGNTPFPVSLLDEAGVNFNAAYLYGKLVPRTQFETGVDSGTSSSSGNAPCVTSYCGPVSVKGYYRKDGTYVRPHTRSPRGSGRRR